jgi:hypothetical protein
LVWLAQKYSFHAFDSVAAFLCAIRIAIGIAALIFSFIQLYNSSTFVFGGAVMANDEGRQYVDGHFTLESWGCQVREYATGDDYITLSEYCKKGVGLGSLDEF